MVQGNSSLSHGVDREDTPSKRHAITEDVPAASSYEQNPSLKETRDTSASTTSLSFLLLNKKSGGHWKECHPVFLFFIIPWINCSRTIDLFKNNLSLTLHPQMLSASRSGLAEVIGSRHEIQASQSYKEQSRLLFLFCLCEFGRC